MVNSPQHFDGREILTLVEQASACLVLIFGTLAEVKRKQAEACSTEIQYLLCGRIY
jgi:hypothetical protein